MVLVTGGTGIVGIHCLLELLRASRAVRALARPGADKGIVRGVFAHYGQEALFDRIEWVEGDLLDTDSLRDAMHGVRHVHHAAALVSFNPRRADALHAANVPGTANVVDAALDAGVARLLHVSSTAAIGTGPSGQDRTEDLLWEDDKHHSDYARSKHLAELEVHRGIAEGLDAVIVNPAVVIGPGAASRSTMALVHRLRKGSRWYTRGTNGFVDARDVAACMVGLMDKGKPGERYLLVGHNAAYRTLFGLLSRGFGHPAPSLEAPAWLLNLARRMEAFRSLLMGTEPLVTRATVGSSLAQRTYSNAKVRAVLGHQFLTLEESTANVVSFVKAAP